MSNDAAPYLCDPLTSIPTINRTILKSIYQPSCQNPSDGFSNLIISELVYSVNTVNSRHYLLVAWSLQTLSST